MISLDSFVVLKRLSVTDIEIQPKKVKARYQIECFSGETDSYDFIKPPYNSLKAEKRSRYTQAKLLFSNSRFSEIETTPGARQTDPSKYAILSSGCKDGGVSWFVHTKRLSKSGVMGNAKLGTAEKGEKMWEIMIEKLTEFVETIKNTPSDKLYQNRY